MNKMTINSQPGRLLNLKKKLLKTSYEKVQKINRFQNKIDIAPEKKNCSPLLRISMEI